MAATAADTPETLSGEVTDGGTTQSNINEKTNSGTANIDPAALPPLIWRDEPLSEAERGKVFRILKACENDADLEALRELATSRGGLVEDEVRRTAWPILLGCARSQQQSAEAGWQSLDRHRDEDQVALDVNRSFVYYPENESEKRTDVRKHELSNVIVAVLRSHPMLHYFQGYHDIVQVLLLVLGADAAIPAVAHLSLLRIRDFMLPSMSGTESHLHLLPNILYAADPQLCGHLSHTQPFFALAATLTLYAHDVEEYGDIARLFDFLLASEAAMPLYLFAIIVISRKDELLEIDPDEPEMLGAILSRLPKPLDLEGLIQRTAELFSRHPPQRLPGRTWSRISSNSVLKSTQDPRALAKQTLADGKHMFARQDAEIKQAEKWKARRMRMQSLARKYRRPLFYTGTTILVVVVAYWFRGSR